MKLTVVKGAVFLVAALLLCGCDAAILVGGKTVGFRSGSFVMTNGTVTKVYPYTYEKVVTAGESAIREVKASQMEKSISISETTLKADLHGDKVTIDITYISQEQTSVAVLVGMAGANSTSELIHERIAAYLRNP
jgi:hypothetical protein